MGKTLRYNSKYGAKRIERDGEKYDSLKEYDRHGDLRMLQRAGEVADVRHHVMFSIDLGGVHICNYEADFTYYKKGAYVVEDTKGFRTQEYRLKKKLMKAFYNIEIKET